MKAIIISDIDARALLESLELRKFIDSEIPKVEVVKSGVDLIAEERERQLAKYDAHTDGSLADLAAYLSVNPSTTAEVFVKPWVSQEADHLDEKYDRIRLLAIAGALIAAEIDRLNRAKETK